jgi:S1-C subfamily serine protease
MAVVVRALVLATLLIAAPSAAQNQALSVLRVHVALPDTNQKATPVPRHALLVSDNPATAPPRRIVTGIDGTVEINLRPGSYTVESDQPVAFGGKAYQWTETVEIPAGQNRTLELNAGNAETVPLTAAATAGAPPLDTDPSFLLPRWQNSIVSLWTPTAPATGFVVDKRGLIVTSQRHVGTASAVEVQLAPDVKVAARVLASDQALGVALLWMNTDGTSIGEPLPIECASTPPAVAVDSTVVSLGAPLGEPKRLMFGAVTATDAQPFGSDLRLPSGSVGGPVFSPNGTLIGVSTLSDKPDDRGRREAQIVPLASACQVIVAAQTAMSDSTPPPGVRLPVEPSRPYPVDQLKTLAQRRAGALSPYTISSADFDIAFMTPLMIYGSRQSRMTSGGRTGEAQRALRALTEFANWSEYVDTVPSVLLVRATPRFVEGFWTTVGRTAAMTQGLALPPIKRFRPGFSRMRVFCGDAELTPIHPFAIEQPLSESEAIHEGLYVFDPDAIRPDCGSVKLMLYSEKEPEKADTRVVDPKVLQQIWDDFAPYRAR